MADPRPDEPLSPLDPVRPACLDDPDRSCGSGETSDRLGSPRRRAPWSPAQPQTDRG